MYLDCTESTAVHRSRPTYRSKKKEHVPDEVIATAIVEGPRQRTLLWQKWIGIDSNIPESMIWSSFCLWNKSMSQYEYETSLSALNSDKL